MNTHQAKLLKYIKNSQTVLELGTGSGAVTEMLIEQGPRSIISYDIELQADQERLTAAAEQRSVDLYMSRGDARYVYTDPVDTVIFDTGMNPQTLVLAIERHRRSARKYMIVYGTVSNADHARVTASFIQQFGQEWRMVLDCTDDQGVQVFERQPEITRTVVTS